MQQQLNNIGGGKSPILPNKSSILGSSSMNISSSQIIPKAVIDNSLAQKT